ncbi:DNA polymerase V [Pantoea eucalypti]|uniref:DNA polymerase V n=1 Tax=Pantoea eucalypti TaxID=470933 RepID=UPI003FA45D69
MPRDYEIKDAFVSAIKTKAGAGRIVTTEEFVKELERLNWHFSLREANQWIKTNTTTFRDVSTQEGEAKTYQQFNPNGGI